MIPQHRGDKCAASCGWLFSFTLPAEAMGASTLTRCSSQSPPVPHGCGRPLWLTCPYGGRTEDGSKLIWQSEEGTGLFLPDATDRLSRHFLARVLSGGNTKCLIFCCPCIPGSPRASSLLVLYLCVRCHRSNLRCLGLFSALVFKSKRFARTIKNVLHDTLSDMEIYNQIKIVASTAMQLNWQLSGWILNLEV